MSGYTAEEQKDRYAGAPGELHTRRAVARRSCVRWKWRPTCEERQLRAPCTQAGSIILDGEGVQSSLARAAVPTLSFRCRTRALEFVGTASATEAALPAQRFGCGSTAARVVANNICSTLL